MQRSTLELKKAKTNDAEAAKAGLMKDIKEFMSGLEEGFLPVWPSWDEVKTYAQQEPPDKSPVTPRNKEGQSENTFVNAMMDKSAAFLVELTAAQKEKVSEFVAKFEER